MLPPVFLILALVFVVIGALIGIVRGAKKTIASLIIAFASIFVSVAATSVIKTVVGQIVSSLVREGITEVLGDRFGNVSLDMIEESLPTLSSLIQSLPYAIVGSVIFVGCYITIRFIAGIVCSIVMAVSNKNKKNGVTAEFAGYKVYINNDLAFGVVEIR